MNDAARAKEIAYGCTHAQGTRGRRRVCLECLAAGLAAHAADQTAALREENARLRLKVRDADVVMAAIDDAIRRGALDVRSPIADARLDYGDPKPEGQRAGEEWRALNEVEKYARVASTQIICLGGDAECQPCQNRELLCQALAAVERARQP